jgi:hypothetical protein
MRYLLQSLFDKGAYAFDGLECVGAMLVLLYQAQDQARSLHLLQAQHHLLRPLSCGLAVVAAASTLIVLVLAAHEPIFVAVTIAFAVALLDEQRVAVHDDLKAIEIGHDEGQHGRLCCEQDVSMSSRAVAEAKRASALERR